MASPPGASRSFPGGWTGARLVASHPNHRRENYVLRAVPRNPAPPAAFLPPVPVASTRTSGMSARAMQVVSGVCKRIGSYLRRAQDVGDRGARALRRGFTCLLPGSRETGRAGPRLRAQGNMFTWRGARGADADVPIDFSMDAWRSSIHRDPLGELTPTERLGIRSRESRWHTEVTFRNATDGKARLFWLNYWGEEVRYKTLEPGQAHTQQTFETHPWTFATVADDEGEGEETRRLVVASAPVFWPRRSAEEVEADEVDGGRAALRRRRERARDTGVPHDPKRIYAIETPASTPWTRDSHVAEFPVFFRLACRELLLSHARLRAADRVITDTDTADDDKDGHDTRGLGEIIELGPAGPEDDLDGDGDWLEGGGRGEREPRGTTLGDLPADVIGHIIKLAAPIVPAYGEIRSPSVLVDVPPSQGPGPVFG